MPDQATIRTHLAVSTDACATWTQVAEANVPEVATIASTTCGGSACTGQLISEVPSLVYDSDEPDASKAWKLFAHRYLVVQTQPVTPHYELGAITLQTAPSPGGPWTAPLRLIGRARLTRRPVWS